MIIIARKATGAPVFLKVYMPRNRTLILGAKTSGRATRRAMADKYLTVAWLENVLRAAVEFVDPPFAGLAKKKKKARAPVRSTVLSVEALANPASVKIGQNVALDLIYEVRANPGEAVEVREIRSLSFQGKYLPTFPAEKTKQRKNGSFESRTSQRIPRAAKPGRYTYRGQVCVKGDCISRTTEFTVVR